MKKSIYSKNKYLYVSRCRINMHVLNKLKTKKRSVNNYLSTGFNGGLV